MSHAPFDAVSNVFDVRRNIPEIAERILDCSYAIAIGLIGRLTVGYCSLSANRTRVPGIDIFDVEHEHSRHRLPWTMSLAQLDQGIADSQFCVKNYSIRRSMTAQHFRTESLLEKLNLPGGANRKQTGHYILCLFRKIA